MCGRRRARDDLSWGMAADSQGRRRRHLLMAAQVVSLTGGPSATVGALRHVGMVTRRHVGQNHLKTVSGRLIAWYPKSEGQTFLVFESREQTQIQPIARGGKKNFFLSEALSFCFTICNYVHIANSFLQHYLHYQIW